MKLTRFKTAKHYETIKGWADKRETTIADKVLLSNFGYIDSHCAGFLYTTNSKVAFIENIIANPDSNWKDRDDSLDMVINKLTEHAEKKGYEIVIGFTRHKSIIERGMRLGFVPGNEFLMIVKTIKEE